VFVFSGEMMLQFNDSAGGLSCFGGVGRFKFALKCMASGACFSQKLHLKNCFFASIPALAIAPFYVSPALISLLCFCFANKKVTKKKAIFFQRLRRKKRPYAVDGPRYWLGGCGLVFFCRK